MSRSTITFGDDNRTVTVDGRCFATTTGKGGIYYARVTWLDSDKSHPACNGDAEKCPDLWRIPVQPKKEDP